MSLKLKNKVALGGLFLFSLLILVGALSFYYLNRISKESGDIVKDNYETLNYTRTMLIEMDQAHPGDNLYGSVRFKEMLSLQEKNITEPGEKELTASLRKRFNQLQNIPLTDSIRILIRDDITGIMELNLKAIDAKNKAAQVSGSKARTVISILLAVCILAGFTFLYNFPSLVASPIASLTEGIRGIAARNYSQRIHLRRNDEFGELAAAFNSMAEKLDEYEHSNLSRILFEKQRAETVINSLKDASIGIDNKGIILFANQQALQMLNLKETEVVGLSREAVESRNDLFRFIVHEKNNVPFRVVLEGKENYFTKEILEISQEHKNAGVVIILKNITPYKELDVAKTNFIATISHELKTPLASSDFSLKLLEDERVGQLNEEQKELVRHLKEDNRRLLKILSELLDMSQVESGKIRLQLQVASPAAIVEKAVASVFILAKEKNITIESGIDPDTGSVNSDAEKTVWVLNNFLSNAIRYSPESSKVIVSVHKKDGMVVFSVQDSGKGIDPQYADKVFERYFRVPGSRQEGTGLGLAICREFIEAQGGSIRLETGFGLGSRFIFELPVASI